jgi:hypothetical protein
MKAGDLVKLNPETLRDWGEFAIITHIVMAGTTTGTISMLTDIGCCSVPWHKRNLYISEVINESR